MIKFQDIFEGDGVFQSSLIGVGGDPLHKISLFCVDAPDHDIAVSDVDSEYHKRRVPFVCLK